MRAVSISSSESMRMASSRLSHSFLQLDRNTDVTYRNGVYLPLVFSSTCPRIMRTSCSLSDRSLSKHSLSRISNSNFPDPRLFLPKFPMYLDSVRPSQMT